MIKKFLVVCISIICATVMPALATTMSCSDTQTVSDGTTVTLSLPKFTGSLSDLTGVWIKITFTISNAVVEIDNDSASTVTGTAKLVSTLTTFTCTVPLVKTDYDTINSSDFTITNSQSFSLSASTGDALGFTATGGTDYAYYSFASPTAEDSGDILSALWANYVGTGNFDITLLANYLTGATFSGSDGYFQGNTPTGTITAEVVYTYVPEPATLVILAIGSLISFRKKIRK